MGEQAIGNDAMQTNRPRLNNECVSGMLRHHASFLSAWREAFSRARP
jgi:hypothetical protein